MNTSTRLKNIEKKLNPKEEDFDKYIPIVSMKEPFYINGKRMPPPILGGTSLSEGDTPTSKAYENNTKQD